MRYQDIQRYIEPLVSLMQNHYWNFNMTRYQNSLLQTIHSILQQVRISQEQVMLANAILEQLCTDFPTVCMCVFPLRRYPWMQVWQPTFRNQIAARFSRTGNDPLIATILVQHLIQMERDFPYWNLFYHQEAMEQLLIILQGHHIDRFQHFQRYLLDSGKDREIDMDIWVTTVSDMYETQQWNTYDIQYSYTETILQEISRFFHQRIPISQWMSQHRLQLAPWAMKIGDRDSWTPFLFSIVLDAYYRFLLRTAYTGTDSYDILQILDMTKQLDLVMEGKEKTIYDFK